MLILASVCNAAAALDAEPLDPSAAEPGKVPNVRADWSAAQIVAGLASSNVPPFVRDRQSQGAMLQVFDLISNEYSSDRQQAVYECLRELIDRGHKAIPALIDGLNDSRYSLSVYYPNENRYRNHRVHDVCWNALRLLLEPGLARDRSHAVARDARLSYCRQVLGDRAGARRWLATRRHRPLVELQIESLAWLARQPNYQRLQAREQEPMAALLAQLRTSRQPNVPDVSVFAPQPYFVIIAFATKNLPLSDGGRIRYWYDPISDSGVMVVRFDRSDRPCWENYCQDVGGLHSEYTHRADAKVVGRQLQVTSVGILGSFVETLDLATGRLINRRIAQDGRESAAAARLPGST